MIGIKAQSVIGWSARVASKKIIINITSKPHKITSNPFQNRC